VPRKGNKELHTNCRRRNACHTLSSLTPCIHVCEIILIQHPQTRPQKSKSTHKLLIRAEPRLQQCRVATILIFLTASKLGSSGIQKRILHAWIPRLRYPNLCWNSLATQYNFVLNSELATISFDAILAFNPMLPCTIGWGQISKAQCIRAALRLWLCQPMMMYCELCFLMLSQFLLQTFWECRMSYPKLQCRRCVSQNIAWRI
jgi:hypothetical protein